MKILHDTVNLDQFFKAVSSSQSPVLLLDYDGTLAPFTTERNKAFPYPGVSDLLALIQSDTKTRLVIISGRAIDDVLPLLNLNPSPEIWGSHGLERRLPDGSTQTRPLQDKQLKGLQVLKEWVIKQNLQKYSEEKPGGVAFHWRGENNRTIERLKVLVYDTWNNVLDKYGLTINNFDGGIEVRLAGISKADAVNEIIAHTHTGDAIAFLGDDMTDEDGFRALKNRGLTGLVRPEFRDTLADIWLIPPDELLDFLNQWYKKAK